MGSREKPVCIARQAGSWLSGDARCGLSCEVGDGRELATLKRDDSARKCTCSNKTQATIKNGDDPMDLPRFYL